MKKKHKKILKKAKKNLLYIVLIIVIILLVVYIILGKNESSVDEIIEKKDFIVEVQKYDDFSNQDVLEKTGKLNSKQEINIASNAIGRVKYINVKEGDNVNSGDVLAVLEDNIANYGISLEKAKNALDRARINYDSNKISLDKQVFDAELNLKTLRKNLEALKEDTTQTIKKAETDLNNADYENMDSQSALELQKFDNSIEKSELDYENTKLTNKETIESYYSTVKKEHNALLGLLDDIGEFSDKILGVTQKYKDDTKLFEMYLGAKNTGQKQESEDYLTDLLSYKDNDFSEIIIDSVDTEEELLNTLEIMEDGYTKLSDVLNSLKTTLNNSISSTGVFEESTITSYLTSISTYQTSLQTNYSSFISYSSSVKSFLSTYLNNEESLLKSINLLKEDREILKKSLTVGDESAEIGYNKTIINTSDAISTLELQISSAENTYNNAQKTRDVSLRSLNNTINDANIAYKQALKEYEKLTIKSPISGVINEVLVDIGQEISNGSLVFNMSNNSINEISISFNKKELGYIEEGKNVQIEFDNKTYTGSIMSIAQVADSNLNYLSKIAFNEVSSITGNIVSVIIPISTNYTLLPINIVKISSTGKGVINILKNNQIEQLDVELGEIYGDKIEILSEISPDIQIITNYIDNFDPEKFNLIVK